MYIECCRVQIFNLLILVQYVLSTTVTQRIVHAPQLESETEDALDRVFVFQQSLNRKQETGVTL